MIQRPIAAEAAGGAYATGITGQLQRLDGYIDRHRRTRGIADFDIRDLLGGRYGGRWRVVVLAVLGVLLLVVVALVLTDRIEDFYLWIRQNDPFPGERPYTHVMRDNPWLYLLPAAGLFVLLLLLLPRRLWLNQVIIVTVSAAAGFLGGHVYW